MKFAEKVKDLRTNAGLTQQQLSKYLGITASAIGYLENGQRDPTGSTLIAYAKYFNISIDTLVGLSPDLEDTFQLDQKSDVGFLTSDSQELLEIYNALDKMHRVQVLEYARYFAERSGKSIPKKGA